MGGYKPNGTAADAAYYQSLANKTEEKTDAIMAKINSTLGITTETGTSKQSEGPEQLV